MKHKSITISDIYTKWLLQGREVHLETGFAVVHAMPMGIAEYCVNILLLSLTVQNQISKTSKLYLEHLYIIQIPLIWKENQWDHLSI